MFEERYERAMENVHPSDELTARTAERCMQRMRRTALLPRGLRLAAALAVMLLAVVALGRFAVPPADVTTEGPHDLQDNFVPSTDVAAEDSNNPQNNLAPLSQSDPTSGYSLTAGTPYLNEEGELCIPLTVTGEGINAYTDIYFAPQSAELSLVATRSAGSYRDYQKDYTLDPSRDHVFRFTPKDGYTYEDLGDSITFTISKIALSSDNYHLRQVASAIADWPVSQQETRKVYRNTPPWEIYTEEYIAELASEGIDYRSLDHRVDREVLPPGEVLLDMGNGVGITAVGYNQRGCLIVQVRQPASAPSSSYHLIALPLLNADSGTQTGGRIDNWWDDSAEYKYTEYTFAHVNADNLDQFTLIAAAKHIYQEITLPLTVTVDLTSFHEAD